MLGVYLDFMTDLGAPERITGAVGHHSSFPMVEKIYGISVFVDISNHCRIKTMTSFAMCRREEIFSGTDRGHELKLECFDFIFCMKGGIGFKLLRVQKTGKNDENKKRRNDNG